jgi:hypothetical protein
MPSTWCAACNRSANATRQARQHALKQPLFHAPDALLAQRHGQRAAWRHGVLHPLERADVLGQCVVHQHLGLALGLQAVEHALHALSLAGQHRFGQLEHVIARHVQHGAFHLLKAQLTLQRWKQQRQLLDLLVRGQQVALHPVGKKLQRALAFLAGATRWPWAARRWAIHCGRAAALHRLSTCDGHAKALQRGEPGAGFGRLVQPRQQHQVSVLSLPCAAFGQLLQATLPSLPGLPEGMRISMICLSANRLSEPPAASTSLQSKCAPATVCTVRSV